MEFFWSRFATEKNRWFALVFLSLGLAIVIIDNSVLNVAIPYILRDLNTSFDAIQWVISGYALIIATLLITVSRFGDLIGRKKVFLLGCTLFAIGSFIASVAPNAQILFLGEALIEAIGASMMLTSSLSLLATEFQGKERALAFGVWGSVAGASATVGPLLGGFLTAAYSWRWSLRINVFVALLAILGSIFIQEAKASEEKAFDWWGTLFSGVGLFSLVFGFIEGEKYGWWSAKQTFIIGNFILPLGQISVIPFAFVVAIVFLVLFAIVEYRIEKRGGSPLIKLSMFRNRGFSLSLLTLGIVSFGQFGIFFILPIYLQNVVGYDAFATGLAFLPASLAIAVFGPLSGILAAKLGAKWIVSIGMFIGAFGVLLLDQLISVSATGWTLVPALIFFGIGVGSTGAQLTNLTISSVSPALSGEASAANATVRQVGTSIGVAIIGVVLAGVVMAQIDTMIQADPLIPSVAKQQIISQTKHISVESGQKGNISPGTSQELVSAITIDVDHALTDAVKAATLIAFFFIVSGAFASLFIPNIQPVSWEEIRRQNEQNKSPQPSSAEEIAQQTEITPQEAETIFNPRSNSETMG